MKTVNIGELKDHLSAYLRQVRSGEEVIICDRNRAIARILPIEDDLSDRERALVEAGIIRLPRKRILDREKFLKEFWAMPSASLDNETAKQAVLDERDEDIR